MRHGEPHTALHTARPIRWISNRRGVLAFVLFGLGLRRNGWRSIKSLWCGTCGADPPSVESIPYSIRLKNKRVFTALEKVLISGDRKMELEQRLQQDMKAAMKSGEKQKLSVIRMLLSDVKVIDLASKPTTAEQAVDAYTKKLRKSLEEFQKLGKIEEVEKLKYEISIAEQYLPKKASPEETERLMDVFLAVNSFTEKQAGQAMGAFLKAHPGQVDPALVNPLMRKKLAGK